MQNRIGPSIFGARAARELLLQIRRANTSRGEADLEAGADLLEAALADPRARRGVMLALVEYLSVALEGSAIKPERWTPLQHTDIHYRETSAPIRKF